MEKFEGHPMSPDKKSAHLGVFFIGGGGMRTEFDLEPQAEDDEREAVTRRARRAKRASQSHLLRFLG